MRLKPFVKNQYAFVAYLIYIAVVAVADAVVGIGVS